MAQTTGMILNNRYRIVKLLGQGGFGAVYRAWDLNLKHPCAVKENLEAKPEAQKQFEREALILSSLTHPSLARVTDYFFLPGQGQYLVMDYVEGEDLQEMLDRAGGPLTESQVLPWVAQVCEALQYMHTQNPPIIHRDIKPANIKITPEGKAMLVDFGIAKAYDPHKKTTIGARAVTPGFSPHEQYGQGTTDARSDVYALGATLYTILTGQEPVESVQRFPVDTLVSPDKLNPRLSTRVAAAIVKALNVPPAQRHQTAAEFKSALTGQMAASFQVVQQPIQQPIPHTVQQPAQPSSQHVMVYNSQSAPAVQPAAPVTPRSVTPPAVQRRPVAGMWTYLLIAVLLGAAFGWLSTILYPYIRTFGTYFFVSYAFTFAPFLSYLFTRKAWAAAITDFVLLLWWLLWWGNARQGDIFLVPISAAAYWIGFHLLGNRRITLFNLLLVGASATVVEQVYINFISGGLPTDIYLYAGLGILTAAILTIIVGKMLNKC